jgi:hypothetical protein
MHKFPKLDPGSLIGGLAFSIIGVSVIGLAIFADDGLLGGPRWLGGAIGSCFLIVGLLILRVHTLWAHHFPNVEWHGVWGGLLALLCGLIIVILSVVDERESAFHAPRWVVTLAGGSFLTAGLLALQKSTGLFRSADDIVQSVLVALLLTCFGGAIAGLFIDSGGGWIFAPGALILGGLALYGWGRVIKALIEHLRRKS